MRPVLFSEEFTVNLLTIAKLALASPSVIGRERTSVIDTLAEIEHQFEGYPLCSQQQKCVKDLSYIGRTLSEWRLDDVALDEQYRLAEMLARIIVVVTPHTAPF